jgi:hypothetical protein
MPKAYSLDPRERVVGFIEDGHSRRAAAPHFGAFQGVGFLRGESDERRSRARKLRTQALRRPTPRPKRNSNGRSKERSVLARLSSRVRTPKAVRNRMRLTRGEQQPWKRKFAAGDFRQDAPGIAPENCRTPTETGPWRGKLRKCRPIVRRRKSRRFARTSWWS